MSAGLDQEDKIISEFIRSIGPWHNHVIIGGGFALMIYKLYFSDHKIGNPPVGTRDIDSLIPRQIPPISSKNISNYLLDSGFKLQFKSQDNPATEAYVKEINGLEIEVEFLTHAESRNNREKNVVISGIVAQPLSYLKLSLESTLKFQTFSNERGLVVSPGAWLFHKGLTFTKRSHALKVYKDLYGIWYVSSQLGLFSNQALHDFKMLSQTFPKWYGTFQKNLQNWVLDSAPIDWAKLESQDPYGKLKKSNFEYLVRQF